MDQIPLPTAPELGEGPSYEDLKERLEIVEQMNRDWVAYNENREIFVQQLTAQNHETTHQLRLAVEEVQKLQVNLIPDNFIKSEGFKSKYFYPKNGENDRFDIKNEHGCTTY